ncbi:hypothetical protein P3T42_000589 [Paraburkholderia sp. GAS38]|jgi:hypothetical protein|uniref:hypothetical protein n=1 Tax=Paraburkholderia sp. GAS38 TaxID=3035133 RepID=UPI003D1DD170
MFNDALHVWKKFRSKQAAQALEDSLETMLKAGQRNVVQFAKLAALARTIRDCDLPNLDRALLIGTMEEIADRAELEATFEAESLQVLLDEQRQNRQTLFTDRCEPNDPCAETFVIPSTSTKH